MPRERHPRAAVALAIALALPGLLALAAGEARAETITVKRGVLPTTLAQTSAVWNDTHAFVFGGWNGAAAVDTIYRYDPVADAVVLLDTRLPSPRYATSAVWTGTVALIFGGNTESAPWTDDVLEFDPKTGALRALDARLPLPLQATSAVWTGTVALVFGGDSPGGGSARILQFDPQSQSNPWTEKGARLPATSLLFTSAARAPDAVYLFGGAHADAATDSFVATDRILRYDLEADEIAVANAKLPAPRAETMAAYDGKYVYVIGATAALDEIAQYDPATDTLVLSEAKFARPRAGGSILWTGSELLVLGSGCEPDCGEIYGFYPWERPSFPVPELATLLLASAGLATLAVALARRRA